MTFVDKKFICTLTEKDVDIFLIPGFIRSLVNALLISPTITYAQVNKRLKYLGWNDIEIDYHIFQLALSSFETKGLSGLEYRPAPFYVEGYT